MENFLEKISEAYASWEIKELHNLLDELEKTDGLTENEIAYLHNNIKGNIEAMEEEQALYW